MGKYLGQIDSYIEKEFLSCFNLPLFSFVILIGFIIFLIIYVYRKNTKLMKDKKKYNL